jgi:acetate CoA/acetoacetate CoA-transferase beta subunit
MGGAMDLVTGARRVIVAMQHTAKGKSKVVATCRLPLTSARPVDLLVTELAVIAFPHGRATLLETAPGLGVADVLAATDAELLVDPAVRPMSLEAMASP